jgi:hypothetical protein
MFSSCELRWFFAEQPPVLPDWYGRRGLHFAPEESPMRRCDHYLHQKGRHDLGIKLREGHVEIKQRIGRIASSRFQDKVAGKITKWQKWSFRLAATREGGTDEVLAITRDAHSRDWIPVYKERLLIWYEIQDEGRVVLVDMPKWIQEGCTVELTRLHCRDRLWYTFGMEAFSAGRHSRRNLLAAMDAFLAEGLELELSLRDAMDYPEFLDRSL